jgi:hypothetical protein
MDESGDLGSDSRSFVISFLIVKHKKLIDKIVIKMMNYKKMQKHKIKY